MISAAALVQLVIYLVVVGLIFWLLLWAIQEIPLPEPFHKVARVLIVVAAVLVLVSLLLGLIGQPVVVFR